MKFIKSISQHVQMRRADGANAFWCLYGDIEQDDQGNYYYTEYAKENPRSVLVNELPEECKKVVLTELTV